MGSIQGWGRSPGGGLGNPVQHPCLENPVDGGAWWATVHGVPESRTRLKRRSIHSPRIILNMFKIFKKTQNDSFLGVILWMVFIFFPVFMYFPHFLQ